MLINRFDFNFLVRKLKDEYYTF